MKNEKVLVCITVQENSMGLISKGAAIAERLNGQLNIVHIEKGKSIFENPEGIRLLEKLFDYGKQLGGEVHFISDESVAERIVIMTEEMGITRLVLGETMRGRIHQLMGKSIHSYIKNNNKAYEVMVIKRQDNKEKLPRRLPNEFAF